MKNRFWTILFALFALFFVGATEYDDKLSLSFDYCGIIAQYRDCEYDFNNHLEYEEAKSRKITAITSEKIKEVIRIRRSGKSEKEALLNCFPSLEQTVNDIARRIYLKPTNSKVKFRPDKEPMFLISREKNGKELDESDLYLQIYQALQTGKRVITVRTKTLSPEVTADENKETFYERGRFSTSIALSSQNRKHNIKTALSAINGSVLAKGETLSFNTKTGVRSEENGYKMAKIILSNEYVDGVGGGVCQASTTLYNCALLSCVEVLQVSAHSLLPSYVEPGFDAMVSEGGSDLVIKNNTGAPLYIKAYASEDTATVIFYGKRNEYKVERKSETKEKGEIPQDKIVIDKENKYFDEGELLSRKRVSYSQPSLKSESYLIYSKDGKVQKKVLLREDYYKSKTGIIAERVEID